MVLFRNCKNNNLGLFIYRYFSLGILKQRNIFGLFYYGQKYFCLLDILTLNYFTKDIFVLVILSSDFYHGNIYRRTFLFLDNFTRDIFVFGYFLPDNFTMDVFN